MNTTEYKTRLFSLLERIKQELPLHEREAIAQEIKEMIEALLPD